MTLKTLKTLTATLLSTVALLTAATLAHAQSVPAAHRIFGVSAFAGGSGVYTGFGRNLSFTAGADFIYHPDTRLHYSLELRGTEPVNSGTVAQEKNFFIGPRADYSFGKFHPYVDVLVGRMEVDYLGQGLPVPGTLFYYTKSHSTAYAGGAGLDYSLSDSWGVKADVQAQRFASPVTDTGHAFAKSITVGLVYTFPAHRRKGRAEF